MITRQLLAKIHIAKKELGITDEIYRDVLRWQFKTESSKNLNIAQALRLIQHFQSLGWKPKGKAKKYDDLGGRDVYAGTPQQLRLIEALWHELYRGNEEKKHLRQFLWNHFKTSDVHFLDRRGAYNCIEALKKMRNRTNKTDKTNMTNNRGDNEL